VVAGLLAHAEDADDHNLPLMYWYAVEPLVPTDKQRALDLALSTELPNLLAFTVRRIVATGDDDTIVTLAGALEETTDREKQVVLVEGLSALVNP
jgi:hypothetical protein